VTSDTLRKFNRDTRWLATGVLCVVASAALVLASLIQEPQPKADDLTKEARKPERDLLLNANATTRFTVAVSNGKGSTGKMTSGQASSVDYAFTEVPPKEISSSQVEAVASNSPPTLAFPPEINRINEQVSATSPVHSQNSAQSVRPKSRDIRHALSGVRRTIDVKARLIALWHQSLARNEKSRNWTAFSNLNTGVRKKAAYTAETSH
jgi:hypothetical protein